MEHDGAALLLRDLLLHLLKSFTRHCGCRKLVVVVNGAAQKISAGKIEMEAAADAPAWH
jgi:hypothetical protein